MRSIDDDLKQAIVRMSVKEKDKLLIRLVAKDEKLVRRLIFELLEGGETRDSRAEDIQKEIRQNFQQGAKDYLTPGYILLYLRHWNARINEHVHATKDKPGEVILVFFMLAEAFRVFRSVIDSFPPKRSDTLAPYVVKRTSDTLKKAQKLHEDYTLEYSRNLQEVLDNIWSFPPMAKLAQEAGLPVKWVR